MISEIEAIFDSATFGKIKRVEPISGGSINEAYKVETEKGLLFLKLNDANQFPNMFEAESKGLNLLTHSSFRIPEPILVGRNGGKQFIIMEWIEQGVPDTNFWSLFGESLAKLHSNTTDKFGLNHDNYIGSLPQVNDFMGSWADFYREQRLLPQIKLAEQQGRLTNSIRLGFDNLFKRLDELMPIEKPALIHGDLWSGNMMVSKGGVPCIFDPAVYYGHREMDLAMMALFGGFGDAWIDSYNDVYPLELGWRSRIQIAQLYPLMVHVNLFGGGYARSVETILKRFV